MSCDIQLANNLAPYGAICEGLGRLRLKAKTVRGAIAKTEGKHILDKGTVSVEFLVSNDSGSKYIGTVTMWPDADEEVKEVTVLELKSGICGYSWECFGLVLLEVPGQEWLFQRVGTFEYTTSRDIRRRSSTTREEWEKHVDLKFNWFKNCPWATVDII
jgi:hypothetical protein